jgi:hypothetical protein
MDALLAIFFCVNCSYRALKNKLGLLEHFIQGDFKYTGCLAISNSHHNDDYRNNETAHYGIEALFHAPFPSRLPSFNWVTKGG